MTFTIKKEQYKLIESKHRRQQLQTILVEYADVIEPNDPETG